MLILKNNQKRSGVALRADANNAMLMLWNFRTNKFLYRIYNLSLPSPACFVEEKKGACCETPDLMILSLCEGRSCSVYLP